MLQTQQCPQCVDTDRRLVGDADVNAIAMFHRAELLELFDLLEEAIGWKKRSGNRPCRRRAPGDGNNNSAPAIEHRPARLCREQRAWVSEKNRARSLRGRARL